MNRAALTRQLRPLLDSADDTATFLEAVQAVIEALYAEDDSECPDGFEALDNAIAAFEEAEEG